MLTLDSCLRVPAWVVFTTLGQDAVLLNTRTNRYFSLEDVGVRFWELLNKGEPIRTACQALLDEYTVSPADLERDILHLAAELLENGLVEIDLQ